VLIERKSTNICTTAVSGVSVLVFSYHATLNKSEGKVNAHGTKFVARVKLNM
jgi:hypothetical protein